VEGAGNVAEAAAAAGVPALVHISAIGADPDSDSAYGASKGEGERSVRAAFPRAVIVRPSIAFGQEDHFVNRFARMAQLLPFLPVIRPSWRLQPVHVADLGKAIALAALEPVRHAGKTYELGGPQILTMQELNAWICETTGRNRPLVPIPDSLGKAMARLTGWLPGAPLSWDQWLMMQKDNVASGPGFEAFGIRPAPLAAIAAAWLTSYRRQGRFAKAPLA
jgi:NADH dehydrogenase